MGLIYSVFHCEFLVLSNYTMHLYALHVYIVTEYRRWHGLIIWTHLLYNTVILILKKPALQKKKQYHTVQLDFQFLYVDHCVSDDYAHLFSTTCTMVNM